MPCSWGVTLRVRCPLYPPAPAESLKVLGGAGSWAAWWKASPPLPRVMLDTTLRIPEEDQLQTPVSSCASTIPVGVYSSCPSKICPDLVHPLFPLIAIVSMPQQELQHAMARTRTDGERKEAAFHHSWFSCRRFQKASQFQYLLGLIPVLPGWTGLLERE